MLEQTKPCEINYICQVSTPLGLKDGIGLHSPLFVLLGLAKHLQAARGLVPLVLVRIPPIVAAEISPSTAEEPPSSVHGTEWSRRVHQVEAALILVVVVCILRPASSKLRCILVHVTPVLVGVARPIRNLQIRGKN